MSLLLSRHQSCDLVTRLYTRGECHSSQYIWCIGVMITLLSVYTRHLVRRLLALLGAGDLEAMARVSPQWRMLVTTELQRPTTVPALWGWVRQ